MKRLSRRAILMGSAACWVADRAQAAWAIFQASGSGSGIPSITSPTIASGNVGSAFSYQITATNSPTSYGATGAPAGTSVNPSSGLVSGTPTTIATSTMNVTATNASGTGNQNVSVTIGSSFTWAAPTSTNRSAVGATSTTVTLNCAAGDAVIIAIGCNGGPVVSVTSPHLTFTWQGRGNQNAPTIVSEIWAATAGSALTAEVITVTQTTANVLVVNGLSQPGVDATHPFDNLSPVFLNANTGTGISGPLSVSTANANVMVVAVYKFSTTGTPTAGAGWTAIAGAQSNFTLAEYAQFNAVQTGLSVAVGTGAGDEAGGVAVILSHDPHDYTVSTLSIDGGPNYFSTVTPATAQAATWPVSRPTLGLTYSNGWDSPNFFPMGNCLIYIDSTLTYHYDDLNWNTIFTANSNAVQSAIHSANLSVIGLSGELFSAGGGGWIPNNGGSLDQCVTGLYTHDEPGTESLIANPIAGIPENGGGTITNALQDSRFWATGFLQASALASDGIGAIGGGTVTMETLMTKLYPTPGTPTRKGTELTGTDAYMMGPARRPSYNGQTVANLYEQNTTPFTMFQIAKGSHQGNWMDYMRTYCGFSNRRPLVSFLQAGNARTNTPYESAGPEINWESWHIIIHGGRMFGYFDHGDSTSWVNIANDLNGGMDCPDFKVNQTVSFDGTISGTTLTVTSVTSGHLTPGMQITAGTSAVATIRAQLTFGTEATFTGNTFPFTRPTWSSTTTYNKGDNVTDSSSNQWQSLVNGNLNNPPAANSLWGYAGDDDYPLYATSVTGTIPVPSIVGSPNAQATGGLWTRDVCITRYPGGGNNYPNGAFCINRQYDHTQAVNASMTCYCPGLTGTYLLDSTVTRTGPMTAKQPNDVVLGSPVANTGVGTIYTHIGATCKRITDLAPVINSPFVLQYIKDTTSPRRYIFPSDRGYPLTHPPKNWNYGALSTGVDCMAKTFAGPSYTSSVSGETISAGFYIFATTGNQEDTPTGPLTVTFHINDPLATSITVIGEARSISLDSGGGTSDVVFHDSFAFCWTVHVYRVNH